ncbi:MAG: helix-turn-helix domain-containing protein [Lachnospiraceae bacterium]|nr:helix-turn-helix domain-containing protein [Lachnospiraceae bacterium]
MQRDEFAERLYAAMRRKKMTLPELADELGMHPNAVGTWTRGEKRPSYRSLIGISRALDVSIDYLCGIQRKATKDETEQLRRIALALIGDVKDLHEKLQTMNKHAKMLEQWARKYKITEEE